MLIIVPPSESKRPPPEHGRPLAIDELSFPELNPIRTQILDALIETSSGQDAFQRLSEKPTMAALVASNTWLRELPTRPASEVYSGPLHEGLDLGSLSGAARKRAEHSLVILSILWGVLRPNDRIPPYRMRPWADLVEMGRVEQEWRAVLPDLLARLAGPRGVVVDLLPASFRTLVTPTGLGDRTVAVRVRQASSIGHRIGDVVAKRVRGQAAHQLLESGVEPEDPDALAEVLGERWPVSLEPPLRPGHRWTMSLTADD